MTSVSARSYVAAGLATAIAGVAVASPVLAQSQIHLPAVSGNVALASEVSSVAQRAVTDGAVEVKQIGDAVRHVMASAPHEAATAATALPGGPLIRKAAATAVTRAVTAVVAANPAGSVTVHRDSASSPAVTAVLHSLPNLQGILGIPALALAIPVDAAEGVFLGADEATLGLGDVLFGLGTGDRDTVQFGINEIASAIPDGINKAVNRVTDDVQAIARALGFNTDAVDSSAVARVAKVADAKNHGAVAVAPKSLSQPTPHDATKPDATKGTHATKGTDSTKGDATADATKADATKGTDTTTGGGTKPSSHSSTAGHNVGATSVKDAGDKGATKAGASTHNGHTPGAASHPGGSGAKHSVGAGAKKGGAKGGK